MIKFQILIFAFILLTQRIEAENPWPRFVASKMTERVINTVWKESESVEMINRNLTPIKLDLPSVAELELNNFAIESLKKILFEKKFFDYAPMCGLEEARQAIVDHFKSEEDNFTRHDVFLTTGASHALQLAIQAIANPGDNILVPNPGWQYYRTLCKANLIEVHQYKINFNRSQESEFNMEQMRNQINEKTRAIIINNPSNPHGVVFSQHQLEKVLKLAEELKLPIISDETFQGMVFDPERVKFHPLTSLEPKVPIITCDGIGKRYLLPGWRLGWLIVHNRFNALTNVRQGIWRLSQIINGPSTMGQGALVQTLNKTPPEFFTHTNKVLAENAKHFSECLSGIPGFKPFPPQAGWFMSVEIEQKWFRICVKTLIKRLKSEMNVHLLDGEIFGMHNWVRIALIVPNDVIEEACNRIEKLSAEYINGPTVNTKQGKVKGFYTQDKVTNVFLGIPYAKPPVDDLRFEKPEPPNNRNELLPAIKHRKTCHIFAEPDWLTTLLYDQDDNRKQSEDCLYLNIFAPRQPKNKKNKKLYPVMFIIHGGGFEMGSSTQYSIYDDISQTFVKHGILVVSIQYRLGQLGFASLGDKVLPGNLGLWDQLEALKWVKANIANFGGDPDEITLFGHSAGSGSVSAHSVSPHSRDLFKRAIQMSGSSFTNWVYGSRVAPESRKLTKALGCKGDSMAIKKCLKKVMPDQIKQTQMEIGTTRNEPMPGLYQPRFDGDFFPEEVPLLAAKAKPKPTLMSFTKLESESFTLVTKGPNGANSTLFETGLKWDELDGYGLEDLSRFIKEHVAYSERFGEVASTVAEEILAFFTSDERKTEKNADYFRLHQYVQLCSDLLFSMGSLLEAKMKASKDWPIYLLQSNFVNDAAFPKEIKIHETYHAYDLDYVFYNPKMPFKFNEADLKIQAFMQESIRNFVKTGNPSAQQITWPKISKGSPNFAHVEMIVSGPVVRENMAEEQKRLAFWKELSKKYPQYDLLFECPRDEKWMAILG